MKELTKLIKGDMVPALGVTEPGSIAFITSKAKSYTKGEVRSVELALSSSIYKGAFTCGIPGVPEVGNAFAAALGICGADPDKGLEALDGITDADREAAHKLLDEGKVKVILHEITPDIYLRTTVTTDSDVCEVTIRDRHTNVVKIVLNGNVLFEAGAEEAKEETDAGKVPLEEITKYTLADLVEYVKTVDLSEIDFIRDAYTTNVALLEEGMSNPRTTLGHRLIENNGGKIISDDDLATAQAVTNTALEARVIGLSRPAMSITASGAHGILCTMPLYGYYKVHGLSEETLLRATALSYLVTIYIKVHSGLMSAFCGCAIAAGTGSAVALCFMKGGTVEQMGFVINNMASSITGMICDGGNKGCTMKGIVAVDIAYRSVDFAMNGAYVESVHAINGRTPEETMRFMGKIAYPGMKETEKTILEIFEEKIR